MSEIKKYLIHSRGRMYISKLFFGHFTWEVSNVKEKPDTLYEVCLKRTISVDISNCL